MAFVPDDHLRIWQEDRTKYVRLHLGEKIDFAAATGIDISASTAKVYLRAFRGPASERTAADLYFNTAFTEVADGSDGSDAIVAGYFTITSGAGRIGPVEFEVVFVDEAVTGQPTISTYREIELVTPDEWGSKRGARVVATVQP